MARIRTIKPEFFTSEDIVSLTPLARLFYVSLWCESDREGRLPWKPRTLKMRYLPGDNCDIDELAKELTDAGLIAIYEVDGKQYAEIPSFKNHQVINNREADSTLPARVPHASPRVKAEGRKEGREGKGKEGKERKEHSTGEADPFEVGFQQFWDAWPSHHRKTQRDKCLAHWVSKKLSEQANEIVSRVEAWKLSNEWTKDDGQFIPAPLVFLHQARYNAVPPPPARQVKSAHSGFAGRNYDNPDF